MVDPRRKQLGRVLRENGFRIVFSYKDPRASGCRYKVTIGEKNEGPSIRNKVVEKLVKGIIPEADIHIRKYGRWWRDVIWYFKY